MATISGHYWKHPPYWKYLITNSINHLEEVCQPKTLLLDKAWPCNAIYHDMIQDDSVCNQLANMWSTKLELPVTGDTICNYFRIIYTLTNITKYRNFQFHLLHNKIFCNNQLFYWKKSDTQQCDFCQKGKQDIIHFLCKCEAITPCGTVLMKFLTCVK